MKIVGSIAAAALLIAGAGLTTAAGAQVRHNVVVHNTVVHRTVVRPAAHRRTQHCTTRWVNHHRVRRCAWR